MIDFRFTEEQDMLRTAAREFAEEVIAPLLTQMEETDEMPEEILRGLGERDFLALGIAEEYGGVNLGHVAKMITIEEVSRVSVAVGMMLQVMHLGIEPIVAFGSPEQKKKYLPKLASGEHFATVGVTEATGGSDPTGIETTARLEGDNYILNGRKVFITNAHVAHVAVVLAKTDEKEFSAFILSKDMPGFRAGRWEHKVGMKGCDTGELIMEDCVVPKENMIGKPGDGLKVCMKAISEVGRAGMAAVGLGLIKACLEASTKFANERILYGKPISRLQGVQFKVADMYLDYNAGMLLSYRAAAMKDRGERCDVEMAMAKYYVTEAAVKAAKLATEIHGGYGVMVEYATQRYLRDAAVLNPSAGTGDIQRIVMARAALS